MHARRALQVPFSANCALSLSSLCAGGDPLCRLTLEAWEGDASATAILEVRSPTRGRYAYQGGGAYR